MLKNYLTIAFRNLARHKGFSFINITGLALGIACCLLIFMYVKDEVTFDKYHANSEDIYRITSQIEFGGNTMYMGASSEIEAKEYAERVPEIVNFTRFDNTAAIVKKGDDFITQFGVTFSDPAIFEMFDFKVVSGALSGALSELNRVVITEDNAIKYFGDTDVVGKELSIRLEGNIEQYIVDAVIENLPSNTSLDMEFILPWKKHEAIQGVLPRPWGRIGSTSFLQLKSGTDPLAIETKIKEIRVALNPGEDGEFTRNIINELQPLTDIHLNTEINGGSSGLKGESNPTFSYILSVIAMVILVLACINFANLTVARSLPRAKEIGVRKVLGALKRQLAFQFLSEAFYVSFLSFIIGLIMAEFFLPVFGELMNKQFTGSVINDPSLIVSCFLLVVFTALLAGTYPSFVVSRFSAISSLNGKVKLSGKRFVSKGLVLVQFTIAGILVVGTLAMNRQITHMLEVDLGYNDADLIVVHMNGNESAGQLLKNELMSNPQINEMALMLGYGSGSEFDIEGESFFALTTSAESNYLDMIEVPLLEGKKLKEAGAYYIRANDSLSNIIVNESFLKEISVGIDDAIGKVLGDGEGTESSRIVGVVADYKHASGNSRPMAMAFFSPEYYGHQLRELNIKYNPAYVTEIKKDIEEAWRKVDPYQPLSLSFKAEDNQNAFAEEKRWKKVITYSTFLAIVISCLGLFGLAHLTAQQRQKEIGVRKVLGASVQQLVFLLNSSFSKLVLLSFALTIPVSYYLISNWLDNFTEKIEIGVLLFLIPAAITFGIATLTVSVQSFRTANSNPVDSLRNE